jgi:hypothetical protein
MHTQHTRILTHTTLVWYSIVLSTLPLTALEGCLLFLLLVLLWCLFCRSITCVLVSGS